MTDSNETPGLVRLPVREMREEPAPQRATDPITQAIEALELSWSDKFVDGVRARALSETAIASLRDLQKRAGELPPLPEPSQTSHVTDSVMRKLEVRTFTADQMQAYARTATAPLMARIVELEKDAARWRLFVSKMRPEEVAEANQLADAAIEQQLRRVGGRQG